MHRSLSTSVLVCVGAVGLSSAMCSGCRKSPEEEQRATAIAEERAQEATLSGATLAPSDEVRDAEVKQQELRANDEIVAAFRLEQSDFRGRLRHALDALDAAVTETRRAGATRGDPRTRALQARRALLRSDLDAVRRSTSDDWATVRTKVERDLRTR